jgi:hypothetical protein
MNILTDVLSLIRRSQFVKKADLNDVLVLGTNEEPEMTGVASPIPYKSIKIIKVRDLKVAAEHCAHANSPATPAAGTGQVYQKTVSDEVLETCTVFYRSLKSLSSNLTLATSADDNYIEITTSGEPNTAANVGSGVGIWKDKVGETLNFRSLVGGSNVNISQSGNEITISATGGGSGEANTASNVGGDAGVFKQKTGVDLEFRTLRSPDNTLSIAQNSNHVDISLPYTYAEMLIEQTGSSAPTANILHNSTGKTFTFARTGAGLYDLTYSSAVADADKVVINIGMVFKNRYAYAHVYDPGNDGFKISSMLHSPSGGSTLGDDILYRTPLTIKIYP